MADCRLCPRDCHADRFHGERGYCGQDARIRAARAALHMWEEPCISGDAGSGAVFFTGCSLGCVYCQNRKISDGTVEKEIGIGRLAEIFLELQEKGANNINLVTAGHFVPQVAAALDLAKRQRLSIPVVYNSSSYELVETLRLLEGLVDIWLPDLKYTDEALAKKYSAAADYPQVAKAALDEMVRQAGESEFVSAIMKKGVIVRHLVLPGQIVASKNVIRYLHERYGEKIYISILNQYTPMADPEKYPELDRKVTPEEYDEVVDYAIEIGVEQGFIQEGETALESFIPEFDITGV
ncbi:MAG: radical SAM protein [Clostridiales bacterium]|nr:radical SAM protein [Clostridiales bacterium]